MPTTATTTTESFQAFRKSFETNGLRGALSQVLALTDYRFIGIWRFQDGKSSAALHFDSERPEEERALEVPENATYCTIVRDNKMAFITGDTKADPRLEGHPARETIRTYCGIPLMDSEGVVLGTLCHYDVVPRNPEQVNVELMLMVASFLTLNGHVPAYPA